MEKVSHRDADSIIDLRDNKKHKWVAVGIIMGISWNVCRYHYFLRKNGHFYVTEALENARNAAGGYENLLVKDILVHAKALGFTGTENALHKRIAPYKLPLRKSIEFTRQKLELIRQDMYREPTDDVHAVVHKHMKNAGKHLTRRTIKLIKQELKDGKYQNDGNPT